jgi:hypothetical protein
VFGALRTPATNFQLIRNGLEVAPSEPFFFSVQLPSKTPHTASPNWAAIRSQDFLRFSFLYQTSSFETGCERCSRINHFRGLGRFQRSLIRALFDNLCCDEEPTIRR